MKKLLLVAFALVVVSVSILSAQAPLPPPFPRTNATKLLENDRIVIWDIAWPKGQPTAMHRHPHDQVGTYYARGGRLITMPDGTSRSAMTEVGSLSTTRKGTTHIEEGTTDPPLRAVFVELKRDTASGVPPPPPDPRTMFPHEGARQLLDDDRVLAWDYTWQPGRDALQYRPRRETVIIWLSAGKIRVTPRAGAPAVVAVDAGGMRYMASNSEETIEVIEGTPRAIVFEFK